ncbi:MAG TPA: hypothetical protein VHW00_25040 [Thermoanaerobaculia bacterium]|nr:hypothetical protein [Thermoanaerobaculia bacterium]
MDQHIKILSVLFIILGVLGILVAVGFFFLGAGTAATILSQDQSSEGQVGAAWAGGCMTFIAALVGVLSIPSIIAGWGLGKRKSWSRILTIILAVFSLPSFPVGTAIGVYALVIMLNDETKRILVE